MNRQPINLRIPSRRQGTEGSRQAAVRTGTEKEGNLGRIAHQPTEVRSSSQVQLSQLEDSSSFPDTFRSCKPSLDRKRLKMDTALIPSSWQFKIYRRKESCKPKFRVTKKPTAFQAWRKQGKASQKLHLASVIYHSGKVSDNTITVQGNF